MKLSPQIKRFIYVRKRLNPQISCPALQKAIQKKFNIRLAKTTIHLYLKKKNKNIGRGRPRKAPIVSWPRGRPPISQTNQPVENMGFWFLKAADLSLCGIEDLTNRLCGKFKFRKLDNFWKNQVLLYAPLFGIAGDRYTYPLQTALWRLVGKRYSDKNILRYRNFLENIKTLGFEAFSSFSSSLTQANYIKITLADNSFFILDGKFQSIYSIKQDIEEFSGGINKVKYEINSIFYKRRPLVVLACPGFEYPPKVFFNFIQSFNGEAGKTIKRISVYSQSGEELERFTPTLTHWRVGFIAALWPWQYKGEKGTATFLKYSVIKRSLSPFTQGNISFMDPETQRVIKLRAVKLDNVEAQRAVPLLVTNIPKKNLSAKRIQAKFLERFRDPEDSYKVYSQRISSKTYMRFSEIKAKQELLKPQKEEYNLSGNISLDEAFKFWLDALFGYCRLHFFPEELQGLEFDTLKQKIFNLPAVIKNTSKAAIIEFIPPKEYPYKKSLDFACRRVNEAGVGLIMKCLAI